MWWYPGDEQHGWLLVLVVLAAIVMWFLLIMSIGAVMRALNRHRGAQAIRAGGHAGIGLSHRPGTRREHPDAGKSATGLVVATPGPLGHAITGGRQQP